MEDIDIALQNVRVNGTEGKIKSDPTWHKNNWLFESALVKVP